MTQAEAMRDRILKGRRRIVLMRHGEVTYFDENGRPHRPDTVPLNEEGRRQAEAARIALFDLPIDRVVASDLARCQETAALVSAGRSLPVETRPDLQEIQPGKLAHLPREDIEKVFVGAFGEHIDRDTKFLGGESFGSLIDRVIPCFQALLDEPNWRCLLIVAHGAVNRAILCHVMRAGLAGFGSLEQDAACLNVLDVDAHGRCLIRAVNHTPYNPLKIGLDLTTMERLFLQYLKGF